MSPQQQSAIDPPDSAAPRDSNRKLSSLREKLNKLSLSKQEVEAPTVEPTDEAAPSSPITSNPTTTPATATEPTLDQVHGPVDNRQQVQRFGIGSDLGSWIKQQKSSKIMIVDDEETNILTVQRYLEREGYERFFSTTDSREALQLMRSSSPDVLLLDIRMPNVDGIDILKSMALDAQLRMTPSIILTGSTDPHVKRTVLELGAYDFLQKPVDPHDLVPRVRNALLIRAHVAKLEDLVERRTAELLQSRQQLILSLGRAAEHRDNETSNHIIRVGKYAGVIAREIGWDEDRALMLEQASQLHDVGKIGIPDSILFKPGKLDQQEFDLMKEHCAFGKEIIEPFSEKDFAVLKAHTRLGGDLLRVQSSPMMMLAARIAQTHHERWDGTGYPLGLAGEDIPIEGRITAVADVFDALSTVRPYKKAFSRESCFEILEKGRGSQFDPRMLDAFFNRSEKIIKIQLDFMDRKKNN